MTKKRVKFNDEVEIRYIDNNSTKSISYKENNTNNTNNKNNSNNKIRLNKILILILIITIAMLLFTYYY